MPSGLSGKSNRVKRLSKYAFNCLHASNPNKSLELWFKLESTNEMSLMNSPSVVISINPKGELKLVFPMKAILQNEFGGSDTLFIGETKTPTPKTNELLVRVKATALNRADIAQREGKYPPPKGESLILGLEFSGTVEESLSNLFKKGDEVFGLVPGGAYAELVCIDEKMALKKSKNLDFNQAAAIPEAFLTAWQAISWIGELKKNERILVHAGASGVGNAIMQLAHLFDAEIFTTCSKGKISFCQEFGANHVIDYKNQSFSKIVNEKTQNEGVQLIIDFIGGDYLMQNVACLAKDGKIVQLATMGGAITQIDLRKLMAKRGSLIASTLRSRSRAYQIELTNDFWEHNQTHFENGNLKPVIDSVWNWEDVQKAHNYMEANKNKGKMVLEISN